MPIGRLAFECEAASLFMRMRMEFRKALARVFAVLSFAAVVMAANAGSIVHASPAPKPMPAQRSYVGALATFVGNQVRLTSDGVTVTVATDSAKRLNPMFAQLASVSPDGTTLLYVTGDGESMRNATMTTVNLTTGKQRVIAQLGNTIWIHQPKWSPDSKQILYENQNPITLAPDIWALSVTGANRRPTFK